MMRVLLLNPPYKPNYIRSARSTWPSISGSNWYPIFLAYATGWLLKHKHEALLLDALVSGLNIFEIVERARVFKPDLLVLYVADTSWDSDLKIGSQIAKRTNCRVVLVGPWCSYEPKKLLRLAEGVDYLVKREFEGVLLDLVNGKNPKDIEGLVYRRAGRIIENPERSFLTSRQLEEFPFVTEIYKRFLPIEKYHQASLLHPFVDFFTGRGCYWGKCTFCLWPATIHKGAFYRTRSLENVIAEFLYIKKELPFIKEVFLQDDTLSPVRSGQIAEGLLKNKINIRWSCYSRGDLDLETMKLMKKSGCRYLHVGYESGDREVLNKMNKGTDPSQMELFSKWSQKAGLKVHGDFIIGLPGETEATIQKTISWAKGLGIEGYQFFLPQPIAGTPLYDFLQKKKYLNKKGEINYPGLSYEDMEHFRFAAMRKIYYSPKYVLKTLKSVESLPDLLRLVRAGWNVLPKII